MWNRLLKRVQRLAERVKKDSDRRLSYYRSSDEVVNQHFSHIRELDFSTTFGKSPGPDEKWCW
jgi:hypothetical protein